MSTGRPPAPEVASMTINLPSEPAGRCTGTETPVDVSLCAQAMRSTDSSDCGFGALPASALTMIGSPTNGFLATQDANFALNSPNVRCSERLSTSPKAAASQNAVDPPLPRMTSYPSGTENSWRTPSRTRPTRFFTGACRCDVPNRWLASRSACNCSGRTFDGPEPKRPSLGLRSAGITSSAMAHQLSEAP